MVYYINTKNNGHVDHVSQAMLYATEGIENDEDFNKPMVGVASVW